MGASWFLAGVPLANNYHRYVIVRVIPRASTIPLGIIVLADEIVGNKRLRNAWERGYGMTGVKGGGLNYPELRLF